MKLHSVLLMILIIIIPIFAEERPNSIGLQFSSFSGLSASYRHYFPNRFGVELHGWNSEKKEVRQSATGVGGMLLFRIDQSLPGSKRRTRLYAFISFDTEYNKITLEEYFVIDPTDYTSDMGTRERRDTRLIIDYGPGMGFNFGSVVVVSLNLSYAFNYVSADSDSNIFEGGSGFRIMVGTMYDFSFKQLGRRSNTIVHSTDTIEPAI